MQRVAQLECRIDCPSLAAALLKRRRLTWARRIRFAPPPTIAVRVSEEF
jgi:hypothetical protein